MPTKVASKTEPTPAQFDRVEVALGQIFHINVVKIEGASPGVDRTMRLDVFPETRLGYLMQAVNQMIDGGGVQSELHQDMLMVAFKDIVDQRTHDLALFNSQASAQPGGSTAQALQRFRDAYTNAVDLHCSLIRINAVYSEAKDKPFYIPELMEHIEKWQEWLRKENLWLTNMLRKLSRPLVQPAKQTTQQFVLPLKSTTPPTPRLPKLERKDPFEPSWQAARRQRLLDGPPGGDISGFEFRHGEWRMKRK